MKLHSYSGFFKDAVNNIIRNRMMSVATIITLIAGLFLFGLSAALTVNIFSITETLAADFKLDVFIDEACDEARTAEIGEQIKGIENVSAVEYISKEEAFNSFKEKYKDTRIFEGIDTSDVLRDSYKVTLTDLSASSAVIEKIKALEGVANITDVNEAMGKFLSISRKVQMTTVIISIILGFLSVLIITNTINMSIFARKKQINIMKYVGATDGYIRRPFIIEGMLLGIIAALLSFFGLFFVYKAFLGTTGTISVSFGIASLATTMLAVGITVAAAGIILGIIGSLVALRGHLKV